MNESFILNVVDGNKIQIEVAAFARLAAQLEEFGVDANVECPSPAVLVVTLRAKMQ
jgi:hypothetical protein